MILRNIIINLSIVIFIISYIIFNYKNSDIILKIVILLFFSWTSLQIIYSELTFIYIYLGIPLLISIVINLFLKYDLLYVFSIIFIIQWIIFLNVNPCSLKYNNKYIIMEEIPEKFRPNQQYLLSNVNIKNINFPIIIKPIICSGDSRNIYIVKNKEDYTNILLSKKININQYMMQELLENYNQEIKILFEKYPWNKEGKIINIFRCPKNKFNEENIIYWTNMFKNKKNLSYLITPELTKNFNEIFNKIPNYYVGRFDILVKKLSDLNSLKFKIIEVNGTMGMGFESDSYFESFNNIFLKDLLIDIKWYIRRILIGFYNIITLNGYNPITLIIVMFISLYNCIKCNDWEPLFSIYS